MGKTSIVYEPGRNDPRQQGIKEIAIVTDTLPPYVWTVYHEGDIRAKPLADILVVPITAARRLFTFRRGLIADCRERRS